MVSIKEVAQLAGVSTATVSRFINNPDQVKQHTRERVQKAISETGYAPNTLARNFRRGKTHIVVVVLPSVGDPFFEGIMEGIWRVAREQGYSILVRETLFNTVDFDEFTHMIFSKQADGIILLASPSPFREGVSIDDERKQPPIILSCENVTPELKNFPSVRIDNVAAATEATTYLISLGHKRIAFMFGKSSSTLTADRETGYRKAMKKAKLPIDDTWVSEGGLTLEGARRAVRKLINSSAPPTAIFCANDEMAIGAIHEIKAAGLSVPEDISVVGFDDIRYAEVVDPPLTTIAQPAEEIGERTMYRLCKAIDGSDIGLGAETVPHKLIVRRSTAKPPQSS
ncbi:LacI family DNA-binding transcriptional regulator [Marinibactrum halimedae]|uniref:DNA-binding transcriptional regulator CytR n=1 Tax=Marinibactrum halimedae TaxID=1444977 RepID=A0AA37WMZ7_9GAMM|nr:LacI family DNA-binding transcriptional regulator [Marinibactrum halimedae]MCD9460344.1 LacI family transcriptional regulator [Marinibactrum halimedae]GLS26780.1 DNA-binding transcriptional regulator CytR [Marinibactrum halimedae]